MFEKIKFIMKCLLENRLRLVLTVMSIAAAVGSVLLIRAFSGFGIEAVSSELDSLGLNGLIVTAESGSITDSDVEVISDLGGIERAAPVKMNASRVQNGCDNANALVWGIDENTEKVVSFELVHGRFIDKGDVKGSSRVCMIDQSLAGELFGRDNAVGKSLELLCGSSFCDFTVIGVVKTGRGIMQSLMGNYFPAFLYAPYTSFSSDGDYTQVFLKTDGIQSSETVGESVRSALGEKVTVTDLAGRKGALEDMLGIVTLILTVIGSISVFVSGISIMNIMLISVNERTKEIGIKKSIGASCADIMFDFLLESVVIAFSGTVLGILAAEGLSVAASVIIGRSITLPFSAIVAAVVISVMLGAAFGLFPAYKASRFRPVEALRR